MACSWLLLLQVYSLLLVQLGKEGLLVGLGAAVLDAHELAALVRIELILQLVGICAIALVDAAAMVGSREVVCACLGRLYEHIIPLFDTVQLLLLVLLVLFRIVVREFLRMGQLNGSWLLSPMRRKYLLCSHHLIPLILRSSPSLPYSLRSSEACKALAFFFGGQVLLELLSATQLFMLAVPGLFGDPKLAASCRHPSEVLAVGCLLVEFLLHGVDGDVADVEEVGDGEGGGGGRGLLRLLLNLLMQPPLLHRDLAELTFLKLLRHAQVLLI